MIVILITLVFLMFTSSALARHRVTASQRQAEEYRARKRVLRELEHRDRRLR